VLRGGSFYFIDVNVRCACRIDGALDDRNYDFGFRLALSLMDPKGFNRSRPAPAVISS
jgi:hypothetical protein